VFVVDADKNTASLIPGKSVANMPQAIAADANFIYRASPEWLAGEQLDGALHLSRACAQLGGNLQQDRVQDSHAPQWGGSSKAAQCAMAGPAAAPCKCRGGGAHGDPRGGIDDPDLKP